MANYRLNESMESRIHREVYVRFGGELSKSRHSNMKMGVGSLAYEMNREKTIVVISALFTPLRIRSYFFAPKF